MAVSLDKFTERLTRNGLLAVQEITDAQPELQSKNLYNLLEEKTHEVSIRPVKKVTIQDIKNIQMKSCIRIIF